MSRPIGWCWSGLARAPVSVGTCPDADKGRGKDAESENGCENCLIHTCSLVSAYGALALHEGLSVCVFSVGGVEVLTQPSLSLAQICGPGLCGRAWLRSCGFQQRGTQCFHDLLRIRYRISSLGCTFIAPHERYSTTTSGPYRR